MYIFLATKSILALIIVVFSFKLSIIFALYFKHSTFQWKFYSYKMYISSFSVSIFYFCGTISHHYDRILIKERNM